MIVIFVAQQRLIHRIITNTRWYFKLYVTAIRVNTSHQSCYTSKWAFAGFLKILFQNMLYIVRKKQLLLQMNLYAFNNS